MFRPRLRVSSLTCFLKCLGVNDKQRSVTLRLQSPIRQVSAA